MVIQAKRYHDISVGHRVHGHEGKCANLHGHNYRIFFTVEAEKLDSVGRVIDFSVIKEQLCAWLENNWDHKFLAWENDPLMCAIAYVDVASHLRRASTSPGYSKLDTQLAEELEATLELSIVFTPFNPTAENMAEYLITAVGPYVLIGLGVKLVEVTIEETRKCSVTCKN